MPRVDKASFKVVRVIGGCITEEKTIPMSYQNCVSWIAQENARHGHIDALDILDMNTNRCVSWSLK